MSLNSNTEAMQELLDTANDMPTADEVYAEGYAAGRKTDTTLTQSGVPADAKATGDAIEVVRSDTSDAINYLKTNHIQLVRGTHYGTEDEIPDDLPEGGLFFKVVE